MFWYSKPCYYSVKFNYRDINSRYFQRILDFLILIQSRSDKMALSAAERDLTWENYYRFFSQITL
jgi:hypothetical protein